MHISYDTKNKVVASLKNYEATSSFFIVLAHSSGVRFLYLSNMFFPLSYRLLCKINIIF